MIILPLAVIGSLLSSIVALSPTIRNLFHMCAHACVFPYYTGYTVVCTYIFLISKKSNHSSFSSNLNMIRHSYTKL